MFNEPYQHDHHPHHPPLNNNHETQSKSFIISILILLLTIYFTLIPTFNNPSISITAVKIPSFIVFPGGSAVSFSFEFSAAVTNPTSATFSYASTSAHLFYGGNQVGSILIPGRHVAASMENLMEVMIPVNSLPIKVGGYFATKVGLGKSKPTLELEVSVKVVGRLNVLWFFSRYVESVVRCLVTVAISDGSVLSVKC